jgi:hypothetical protein
LGPAWQSCCDDRVSLVFLEGSLLSRCINHLFKVSGHAQCDGRACWPCLWPTGRAACKHQGISRAWGTFCSPFRANASFSTGPSFPFQRDHPLLRLGTNCVLSYLCWEHRWLYRPKPHLGDLSFTPHPVWGLLGSVLVCDTAWLWASENIGPHSP